MVFNLKYTESADRDIDFAIDYYEAKQTGLGKKFFYSLKRKMDLIQSQPQIFPAYGKIYHKAILGNFPYNIFFSIEADFIIIEAVIHQSRGLQYLKSRMH